MYWNNIPAPYMVDRFNTLARRGNIELEAWFGARSEADRSWTVDETTWQFTHRYLPRLGVGSYALSLPVPVLTTRRPDLMVSLYATPSFLIGLRLAWWRQWPTSLWVETTFDSWVRRSSWKERLKRTVFRRVGGVVTAGPDGRAFAMRYGVPSRRIEIVRHVVDVERIATNSTLTPEARDEIRAALGVVGVVFAYVGRLWQGKGILTLLDAYTRLASARPSATSLLVVGDGPEREAVQRVQDAGRVNVRLAGFHQQDALPRLYGAADVFVFPTLGDPYGLVIDEAMAAGLPVISTTAVGEVRERVSEGENGYLVPPGDVASLVGAMARLASDAPARAAMGRRSAELIAAHTLEHWAETFETAVERIVASK